MSGLRDQLGRLLPESRARGLSFSVGARETIGGGDGVSIPSRSKLVA
jgi:hypothetical protein